MSKALVFSGRSSIEDTIVRVLAKYGWIEWEEGTHDDAY